jgi:hypothetical protein
MECPRADPKGKSSTEGTRARAGSFSNLLRSPALGSPAPLTFAPRVAPR